MKGTPGLIWSPSLHLSHCPLLPNHVQNDDAVKRRADLHQVGVGLGVQHDFAAAVPLNLQDVNRCLRCLAFQIEGFAKLW